MTNLFADQMVAGFDEYELRRGLENVLRTRLHQGKQTVPEGPAGAALVWEFLAGHAKQLFRKEVLSMRADGHSWRSIAEQLNRLEAGEEYESTVRVFNSVANSHDIWDNPQARWTCTSCDRVVLEDGPEGEAHPVDNQRGHAESCERLAAEEAAYVAERGDW